MLINSMDRRETFRRIWRMFGWLLALVAAAFLVHDLVQWQMQGGAFKMTAADWIWFILNEDSLVEMQSGMGQRLWAPFGIALQTILGWPAFVVFGLPAVAILYTAYSQRARKRRWR